MRSNQFTDHVHQRTVEFLETLAPKDAVSGLLHATISKSWFQSIYNPPPGAPPKPGTISYEVCDLPLHRAEWSLMKSFVLQAVIHFNVGSCGREEILPKLTRGLRFCFTGSNNPAGQLFLCGIPALVLSPEELSTSSNVKEDALLKLFNGLSPPRRPKWEVFTAIIHLVEPGFRPSADDLGRACRLVETPDDIDGS